jgi:cell division protein FtsW
MRKSPLLTLILILISISLIFISISSLSEAVSTIGDKYFFIKRQLAWITFSIIAFFIFSKIKIDTIKKQSFTFYLFSLFLLILVLVPEIGNEVLGARRWLNLGFISIQPSELLKFTSIIFFSYLFAEEKNKNLKKLLTYLVPSLILIIAQPNLSTAILIALIVISIYYLSGSKLTELIGLSTFSILIFFILIVISPYRSARLQTLIKPQEDISKTSYHSYQVTLAISSGGIWGKGFANSDQKYKFLPKISTDSILAVIGEETGLIGISLIVLVYIYLIAYLFKISLKIPNNFESLIISGTACWIAYQTIINMSAIVSLIPLTGVPLPFISYGGSSLITLASIMGIIKSIENKNKNIIFDQQNEKNNNHRHPSHSSPRAHQTTTKRHKN